MVNSSLELDSEVYMVREGEPLLRWRIDDVLDIYFDVCLSDRESSIRCKAHLLELTCITPQYLVRTLAIV